MNRIRKVKVRREFLVVRTGKTPLGALRECGVWGNGPSPRSPGGVRALQMYPPICSGPSLLRVTSS